MTFMMRVNEFGLYEFVLNNGANRIPAFLRPPMGVEEASGGLARQTTIGNFHGPFIEHLGGVERLVVRNEHYAMRAAWEMTNHGYRVVMQTVH
jgi:hypothetical protein